MKQHVSFFPTGNADTTLIKLADGQDLLFDYADMRCPGDQNDPRIDLASTLNNMIDGDYEVVCFTHLDKDHILGMSEYFYLEHAACYQGEGRKKIKELWVPANVLIETSLSEPDAKILRAEARYRLRNKQGIRVFSRKKVFREWCDQQEDICFDDITHLIVDAGTVVPSLSLANNGIEVFAHAPFFSDSTDIDRNNEGIVVQLTFNDQHRTKMILGSDTSYWVWDDIVRVTRHFGNDEKLEWDLFKVSHHCSYLSLAEEKGTERTIPTDNIRWLFEQQGHNRGWIISPSWHVPPNDDDNQPPHRQAANYYRKIASEKNGKFLVTMDHPTQSNPKPMTFEIDAFSGLKLVSAITATTLPPFVHDQRPARAGHGE